MFMVLLIIPFCISLSSCDDDKDELDDPNNPNNPGQSSELEEKLVNYSNDLTLYEDDKYIYKFKLDDGQKDIEVMCNIKAEGNTFNVSPFINGKWLCGMKLYSKDRIPLDKFKSLTTKYTDYDRIPENRTTTYRPVIGGIFLIYLRTSNDEIIHYKIYVSGISYNTKDGFPETFKYLKVYCTRY